MPPKKQAVLAPAADAEPPAKKAKVEGEDAAPEAAETKAAGEDVEMKETKAEPTEKEQDSPADKRKTIKDTVITFDPSQTTLNVVPAQDGRVLMSCSGRGVQHLIAGARASVAITAGRYMFEVQILSVQDPGDSKGKGKGGAPPRQVLRLGVSAAGSSLLFDGEGSASFDADGFYSAGKQKKTATQRFGRNDILAVLVNLDPASPNANTISLFRNGTRACEPQPLPEDLQGKPLYPHVNYRTVALQMNFGSESLAPLPFKCRMLKDAAKADTKEAPSSVPKDGKYDVIFPVAFPDEGSFEWLDAFLEKNPQYVELSDRKIQDWALKSGLWKSKNLSGKNCNDKPDFSFGIPAVDDRSAVKAINALAPLMPRNYVVMEVKQNLVKADRAQNLKHFRAPHYKPVAHVMMCEPPEEFKKKVQKTVLAEKQAKAVADWKLKQAEKKKKKEVEQRQKQLQEMQKKAQEKKKALEEEAAKKAAEEEAAKKAAEGEGSEEKKAEEGEEKKDEEKKDEEGGDATKMEEEKKEEVKKEEVKTEEVKEESKDVEMKKEVEDDSKDVKEEEEEEETEPPVVELTEEEKKIKFRAGTVPDLTAQMINAAFAGFSIPEKSEGFAAVKFEWSNESKSKAYLGNWVTKNKVTARVEDLQPSEWFKTKVADFEKAMKEFQAKLLEFKNKKEQAEQEKEKAKPPEEKKEGEESTEGKETTEGKDGDEGKEGAEKKEGAEGAEEKKDEPVVEEKAKDKAPDVDISSVTDINDIGDGEPLYSQFTAEDWVLYTLRYEVYLLVTAYKKAMNDPERVGIHESNILFYFTRYFRRQLNPKLYGKDGVSDVLALVKDTVTMEPTNSVLKCEIATEVEDAGVFVKMAEQGRRERQRQIAAGNETAKLHFSTLLQQPQKVLQSTSDPSESGTVLGAGLVPRMVPPGAKGKGWGKGWGKDGGWGKQWQNYAPQGEAKWGMAWGK